MNNNITEMLAIGDSANYLFKNIIPLVYYVFLDVLNNCPFCYLI